MKKTITGLIVLLVVVVAGLMVSYNGLVNLDEEVQNKWSQVETNYQRRTDLIPNLANTVKGYAEHESETFKGIAELRSGYKKASTPKEYQQLDKELSRVINIAVESYPQLKANENFLALQDELAGTENRIAVSRRDYNNAVTKYNKKIRRFPTNMMARMFGFDKADLFEAEKGAEKAPEVNFD